MASKKPTKEDRADDLTQFLEQILPRGGSGKGRAPQLAESFKQDAFHELTRSVLVSPFEVFDTVDERGGDAAFEAAFTVDLATALYLGQAAMWHAVARLLGKSGERTEDQVNRILFYFSMVFLWKCAPVLIGKGGTKLRKPEQLVAVIDRLEEKYWSQLPGMQGRPRRKGKRASDLPTSFFKQVDVLRAAFSAVKKNAFKPYKKLLGEDAWESGKAWRRILDLGSDPGFFEYQAQQDVKKLVEIAGLPVHILGYPGMQFLLTRWFEVEPREAALRFQIIPAHFRYGLPASYREIREAYYAWKPKK